MDDHAPYGEFETAPARKNPLLSTMRYREEEILKMDGRGIVSLSSEETSNRKPDVDFESIAVH